MWLIISTPSNPASLTIFMRSRTEPFTPIVAHMIPFLSWRLADLGAEDALSSAATRLGAKPTRVATETAFCKNARRFILGQRCSSGHSQGLDAKCHFPIKLVGDEFLLRIHRLLPRDLLAG